jgi:hypothetical protein
VTITISFGWGDIQGTPVPIGTGAVANFPSQTPQYTLAQVKAQYTTAVGLQPTNIALATAFAKLPATYPNPGGLDTFFVPDAEFKALTGMAQNPDPLDGFTGYATDLCSGAACPDFTGFVEHEGAHAMGRVVWAFQSGMPPVPNGAPPKLSPLDFFKYDCGTTTLDPRNNQTCFSIDGGATNPGGRVFDNTSNSSDWTGFPSDSYNFQVFPGASVSTADILEMCALGWNNCAVPEPGTMALLSTALLSLGLLGRYRKTG